MLDLRVKLLALTGTSYSDEVTPRSPLPHRFGISAPGAQVLKTLGITVEHVVEVTKSLL